MQFNFTEPKTKTDFKAQVDKIISSTTDKYFVVNSVYYKVENILETDNSIVMHLAEGTTYSKVMEHDAENSIKATTA